MRMMRRDWSVYWSPIFFFLILVLVLLCVCVYILANFQSFCDQKQDMGWWMAPFMRKNGTNYLNPRPIRGSFIYSIEFACKIFIWHVTCLSIY